MQTVNFYPRNAMKRCALTVGLRDDQAVLGHRPPHMVSKPASSTVATSIQRTRAEMKQRFSGDVCVCVDGLAPHEQTRMRSLLLPWHPSTRNWDNECWETLEQCNFTSDQLFKRVMTAFMQLCVCACVCLGEVFSICVWNYKVYGNRSSSSSIHWPGTHEWWFSVFSPSVSTEKDIFFR